MAKMKKFWIRLGKKYLGEEFGFYSSKGGKELLTEIRKRLFNYVWDLMKKYGEDSPPFLEDPKSSSFLRARKVLDVQYCDIEGGGNLAREKKGFIIKIHQEKSYTRKRTTLAHEIGHIFLFDLSKEPPEPSYGADHFSWEIEDLAFEIGRRILIPKKSIKNYLNKIPSLNSFLKVKRKFQVSADILARSIFHDYCFWTPGILFAKKNGRKFTIPKSSKFRFWNNDTNSKKRKQIVNKIEKTLPHLPLIYQANKTPMGSLASLLLLKIRPTS